MRWLLLGLVLVLTLWVANGPETRQARFGFPIGVIVGIVITLFSLLMSGAL